MARRIKRRSIGTGPRPDELGAIAVPPHIPALLAFIAGGIDACTVIALFGLFVAQATGSFVVIGTEIITGEKFVLIRVMAIPVFLLAAVATAVAVIASGRRGRPALVIGLTGECVLLLSFWAVMALGTPFRDANAPLAVVAGLLGLTAMGAQSALVRMLMRDVASTNVMTTNTTLLGIDLAEAFVGRRHRMAARKRLAMLWPIMLGFLLGTTFGALGYEVVQLGCVLALTAMLAAVTGYLAVRR